MKHPTGAAGWGGVAGAALLLLTGCEGEGWESVGSTPTVDPSASVYVPVPGDMIGSSSGYVPHPGAMITSPSTSVTATSTVSPAELSGTAWPGYGFASVTWTNAATGASGVAVGDASWTATVPLLAGENRITIEVRDVQGYVGTDAITITYFPGGGAGTAPYDYTGYEYWDWGYPSTFYGYWDYPLGGYAPGTGFGFADPMSYDPSAALTPAGLW